MYEHPEENLVLKLAASFLEPVAHEWLVVIPLTIFLLFKCSNILYKASIYVFRKITDPKKELSNIYFSSLDQL